MNRVKGVMVSGVVIGIWMDVCLFVCVPEG